MELAAMEVDAEVEFDVSALVLRVVAAGAAFVARFFVAVAASAGSSTALFL